MSNQTRTSQGNPFNELSTVTNRERITPGGSSWEHYVGGMTENVPFWDSNKDNDTYLHESNV